MSNSWAARTDQSPRDEVDTLVDRARKNNKYKRYEGMVTHAANKLANGQDGEATSQSVTNLIRLQMQSERRDETAELTRALQSKSGFTAEEATQVLGRIYENAARQVMSGYSR